MPRPAPPSRLTTARLTTALLTAVLMTAVLMTAAPASAQDDDGFGTLSADQRIVDLTGDSLDEGEVGDLRDRMAALGDAGADGVVVVRHLDASPEDTLDQVEALQQAWVDATGAPQDTAVAILVNRNPEDEEDARAGVFVGRTFQEGNVPTDEQEDIIEDALIPPLREGDVHASLAAGIDRLTSSVVNGPPVSAFDVWAEGAATTWLTWAAIAVALLLLGGAVVLYRRRQTTGQPAAEPTSSRPGDLAPAVAAALAGGAVQAQSTPATLLDLATRGALAIEPVTDLSKDEGGDDKAVQVRLVDGGRARGPVEDALWAQLQERAGARGLVTAEDLKSVADAPTPVNVAIEAQMAEQGWLDADAGGPRAGLIVIGLVGGMLAIPAFLVVAASGQVFPSIIGAIALLLVVPFALLLFANFPRLSTAGQEAAIPWRAYREGLERAVRDGTVALDLDAALPYVVAFGQGSGLDDRLEAAATSGQGLRAFAGSGSAGFDPALHVLLWAAFNSSTSASPGAYGGTVSGVSVSSGGGGAAGST